MIWLRVIVTIGIAALLVVACVTRDPRLLRARTPGDASRSVAGAVVLDAAYGFYDNDQHCRGTGDYSDVTEGAQLTLANDFKIERVALRAEFYTFTVAGRHPIQVQPHDMRSYLGLYLVR